MLREEKVKESDTYIKSSPVCVCNEAFWRRKKKSSVPNVPKSVAGIDFKNNKIFQYFFLLSHASDSKVNMLLLICHELTKNCKNNT